MRTRFAILAAAAALSLGGCAYNGLGVGMGYGSPYGGYYDPYYSGYGRYGSGVRIGYGLGYGGYGGYGGYYGSPYGYGGYGYGMPYWGWYDNWYYPGTGYYVYDRYRNRQVWTDAQKAYWTERLKQAQATNGVTKMPNTKLSREIWADFNRPQTTTSVSTQSVTRASRPERIQRTQQVRSTSSDRRAERQAQRLERSSDRGVTRSSRSESRRSDRDN